MVKPSKALYPDYYLIIKYPIAFDNVSTHIEQLAYNSLRETLQDFHLIFSNARIYNTEGSVVYDDSLELEKVVIDKYHEIMGDDIPISFTEFDEQYATKPLALPPIVPSILAENLTDEADEAMTETSI